MAAPEQFFQRRCKEAGSYMRGIFAAHALASELKLVTTCSSCPEQYDVFHEGKRVGYMRLRNGTFRVECPECGGELVFISESFENGAGSFRDEDERNMNLSWAKRAIAGWMLDHMKG